ncbi:hypothetical protein BDP27DRAFT_487479 [Rhodocollybia butyracea]|uniref:Zn(2)-C6 fungal-type domain-containing protein n=1 Tax=Rhodocollybia butyracea TaxID=206335 RepID=A0A9P5Q8Z4_9AGAR|nr:hypothetical protein BDP27DRAFT_487479 [Rhodocollybia butyracea]
MYHFSPSPDRLMEPHNMARSWEPSNTGDSRNVEPPTSAYPSLLPVSTRHESTEPDDDDGEYLPPGSRRGRKRKLPSLDERPQAKPKGKKTLIACDFCRGRKLRCDGKRPSCSNCKSRDDQLCVYQSHPRRRGPGKAPKGSRKKKSEVGTSASNDGSSQRYSTSGDDFDLPSVPQQQQTQGPTLLPYPSSRGPSRMNDLAFSQDSSQRYTGKTEDTEESVHPPHHHPHPDPF